MSERAATFDNLYRSDRDPWKVHTSPYEREKYSATLHALGRPSYGRALELGCSIGAMTPLLADRCESLLAIDVSDVALGHARAHCHAKNVTFRRADIPEEWPSGSFDLVVLSEILYFLSAQEVAASAARTAGALNEGGEALLVNWIGETTTALTGHEAAELFIEQACSGSTVRLQASLERPLYRIDLLSRAV